MPLRLPLLLLALCFLAVSCGADPAPRSKLKKKTNKSTYKSAPAGPQHNWAQMAAKVKDAEARKEKALNLMEDAGRIWKKAKPLPKGTEREKLKNQAIELKTTAGDMYDMLYEEAIDAAGSDELGEKLWKMRFGSFSSKFSRLEKKVARIQFL